MSSDAWERAYNALRAHIIVCSFCNKAKSAQKCPKGGKELWIAEELASYQLGELGTELGDGC